MKTLVVEDDPLLGQGIVDALGYQKQVVEWAKNGRGALDMVASTAFDVIILDLGLPDMDGITVLKKLRSQGVETPVLILTARDATDEKVSGLDAGADDYMAKPFDLPELSARLRALVRRGAGVKTPTLTHGSIEIDPAAHSVCVNGEAVSLSRYEFDLLHHLVAHPGRVYSREALVEQLYSWSDDVGSNTIEVYIHHLRKKLGKQVIETVRGVGYRLGVAP